MSSRESRLKIFDALTAENRPPIPLNDDTVTFSLPVAVDYIPGTGDEDYWNTKITVTARPGSGYTGSVDIFYTRLDLKLFDNGSLVFNEYPYTPEALVAVLNRLHQSYLTVDDLETIEVVSTPKVGSNVFTLLLRAREDSLAWIGDVTLQVARWADALPDPSQDSLPKTYYFASSLVWNVKHNLNTTNFIESITNSDGIPVYAFVHVLSPNEFQIEFTEPEAGRLNVIFFMDGSS